MNPEIIRCIVGANGITKERPESKRRLIMAVARYYARQVEQYLGRLLLEEFERVRPRRMRLTGDVRADAKRHWRRLYQRQYRSGARRREL